MLAAPTVPAPAVSHRPASLPAGSCDAHGHIFGPFDAFPLKQPSLYPLPDADPHIHAAFREALGVTRAVLTQPAPYADDASAMLAAIAHSDGALRGVAVADADIADETLAHWSRCGIVGLRFIEMRAPGGERYPGSVPFAALLRLAPRMREFGLHAQLWARVTDHVAWLPRLLDLGIPLVIDHLGCPAPARGVADRVFTSFLDLAGSSPLCWVKLVICRVGSAATGYDDARPFHDALVDAIGERCVWGSDWPYVRLDPAPDAGSILSLFQQWVPDLAVQRRILVDNPAQLYRFEV